MSCSSALSDVLNTELFHSQPLILEVSCPCTGKVFLERARQAAGSAAAAVAAAVASGLQSVPDSSPFRGLESGIGSGLPAAVETAFQIALLAGTLTLTCSSLSCILPWFVIKHVADVMPLCLEVTPSFVDCQVLVWAFMSCCASWDLIILTQVLQRVAHPICPKSKMHPCSRLPR